MLLFNDTFTNFYNPEIGVAAMDVLRAGGLQVGVAANVCCGRPLISKGLLSRARDRARENVRILLSAMPTQESVSCSVNPVVSRRVSEDAPSLLRGEEQRKARLSLKLACCSKSSSNSELAAGRIHLEFGPVLTADSAAWPLSSEVDGPGCRLPGRCSRAFRARKS